MTWGSFSLKIFETKQLSEKFQDNFWNTLINRMEAYKWISNEINAPKREI